MSIESADQLIPYLVLERYLKKKYLQDIKEIDEFIKYISSYFDVEIEDVEKYISMQNFIPEIQKIVFKIPQKNRNYYEIIFMSNGKIENKLFVYKEFNSWKSEGKDIKSLIFEKSKKTQEFFDYFVNQYKSYRNAPKGIHERLQTNNNDFLLDIDTHRLDCMLIVLRDKNNELYSKKITATEEIQTFENNKEGKKYTEEEIAEILISLKIDISMFPEEEREEITQLYIASLGNFAKEKEDKLKEFRKLQIERIMLAYQKFKEIAELLNDTKMDLKFDKVKIDNLSSIIFKDNGNPTEKGFVEFEDFFRGNMILRMLDLSDLDLTNVNITHMDFSGTNIHINPQIIYNKDMSGVNALDVHFSPFTDNFDDVILDGALINDYEAMIDLTRLRSYSDTTVIKKEVISTHGKL